MAFLSLHIFFLRLFLNNYAFLFPFFSIFSLLFCLLFLPLLSGHPSSFINYPLYLLLSVLFFFFFLSLIQFFHHHLIFSSSTFLFTRHLNSLLRCYFFIFTFFPLPLPLLRSFFLYPISFHSRSENLIPPVCYSHARICLSVSLPCVSMFVCAWLCLSLSVC